MSNATIKYLSATHVYEKSVDYIWTNHEYGTEWKYFRASRCDKCDTVLVTQGEEQHKDIEENSICEGHVFNEGPMMNYWYPCHIEKPAEEAKKIVDLPLCIVEIDGKTGFALTGGGMDFSWQICEAYMLQGYLPPAEFADLPVMSGKDNSQRTRWVVSGCEASFRAQLDRANHKLATLRSNFPKLIKDFDQQLYRTISTKQSKEEIMKTMNRVTLMGYLAADPEVKTSTKGKKYVLFSMATNKEWMTPEGEKKQAADFHRVVSWNDVLIKDCVQLKKGSPVLIEGKINNRTYEKNGERRYITEITADNINVIQHELISSKESTSNQKNELSEIREKKNKSRSGKVGIEM